MALLADLKEVERTFPSITSSVIGWVRFRNKILTELEHPSNATDGSNLPHLEAVFHTVMEEIAKEGSGTIGLEQKFWYANKQSQRQKKHQKQPEPRQFFRVDIVSRGGTRWTKIKAESAKNIHRKCQFMTKFGEKSIFHVAQEMIHGASANQVHFRCPEICFKFSQGVTMFVSSKLKGMGVVIEGEILPDPPQSQIATREHLSDEEGDEDEQGDDQDDESKNDDLKQAEHSIQVVSSSLVPSTLSSPLSHNYKINLDVTAVVAFISDLCNISEEKDRIPFKFDGIFEWMRQDEQEHPTLPLLQPYFNTGGAVMCESAWRSLAAIVSTIAGPSEKERYNQLKSQIIVVPDQPSTRASGLLKAKKINSMTVAVFGTGDSLQISTLTANLSFLRAAKDKCVEFSAILHPARALSEQRRMVGQEAHLGAAMPYKICGLCGF